MSDKKIDLQTELIHHPYQPPAHFEAVPPGTCKTSTGRFRDGAESGRANA